MATIDLSRFAVGGATRPDSFTGLDPSFLQALQAMVGAAPPHIQQNLRILSGFRSPERQAQLWQGALAKYGSPERARKWVAPPGKSFHNRGQAVDLKYLNDAARAWAHENAPNFGLHFPLANEPWHIEPVGTRRGGSRQGTTMAMAQNTAGGGSDVRFLRGPEQGPASRVAGEPPHAGTMNPPAPVAADDPGQGGGFGAFLAALAPHPGQQAPFGGLNGPEPEGPQPSGDPMGATMSALQMAEKAKALRQGLLPDLEGLLSLGKRPVAMG